MEVQPVSVYIIGCTFVIIMLSLAIGYLVGLLVKNSKKNRL
jgi:hypothetical protein